MSEAEEQVFLFYLIILEVRRRTTRPIDSRLTRRTTIKLPLNLLEVRRSIARPKQQIRG
jgi:hypothetical protein